MSHTLIHILTTHTHNHIYTQTNARTQFHAVVGVLTGDTDPMVSVMKLEKAPDETYADIGGLDQQIQEIKVRDSRVRVHNEPEVMDVS